MPYGRPNPPWHRHVPGVKYGSEYILEPKTSQSVLRAQINEHAVLHSLATGYECAVAAAALGVAVEDLPSALVDGEAPITSSGNLLGQKYDASKAVLSTPYGVMRAVGNSEAECGMSEDCVIALEQYYLDLQSDDNQYERFVCYEYIDYVMEDWSCETGATEEWLAKTFMADKYEPFDVDYWDNGTEVWLRKTFGANKAVVCSGSYEGRVEEDINDGDYEIDHIIGWQVDLLTLPINAQAATYYSRIDPQSFVEKLEAVDVSTIPAEDMRCMHCFSDFDEVNDDEIIQLMKGSVPTDNSPVKMPCPHGHLIGKTCLMQIIDHKVRLCPYCRFEIVPEGRDPRGTTWEAEENDDFVPYMLVPEQYSVWD